MQEVQEDYDGLLDNPPEAFPAVWPHPAAPANMPPANGLRVLANRYLNNPDSHVNTFQIKTSPGGRFEILIALESANIL